MSYSIIPVFVPHAGCPHDCVFCNQRAIAGQVQVPTWDEVSMLISDAIARSGADEVAFYGGSFTALSIDEMEAYLRAAYDLGIRKMRVSTRPDAIDAERLKMLKKYCVDTIELGAQSMDDKVLTASARGHDSECVRTASREIRKSGFKLIIQMMVGLPGEDENSAIDTAREIARIKPDGVRVYPTVVVKDTALEELWSKGEYEALTVERAVKLCAEISDIFEASGIPVIRMGLNPSEELSGGSALAGAYHPAFGQLVAARRRLNDMKCKLQGIDADKITIYANPRAVSEVAGHKGENRKILYEEFRLKRIAISADETLPYENIKICKNS